MFEKIKRSQFLLTLTAFNLSLPQSAFTPFIRLLLALVFSSGSAAHFKNMPLCSAISCQSRELKKKNLYLWDQSYHYRKSFHLTATEDYYFVFLAPQWLQFDTDCNRD